MPSALMRITRLAPANGRNVALAVVVLLAAACTSEEAAQAADEARAVMRTATPERFAGLLRERYARERACLEQRFPQAVVVSTADTTPGRRFEDEIFVRPYELLRSVGVVTREEVHPGDPDWKLARKARVDSGGADRIVRYVLTDDARRDAEAIEGGQHLCYARPRFVTVDSIVPRGLSPSWSPDKGVRYSQAMVFARHVVVFDSVPEWAHEVARRDSLQSLGMLRPALLHGPQHRWSEFWVRDGDWMYAGTHIDGPQWR